jgi:hypothetical protein
MILNIKSFDTQSQNRTFVMKIKFNSYGSSNHNGNKG